MIKYIKPLPISEEKLGAYLEGNLSTEESRGLEELLDTNAIFKDFVEEVAIIDDTLHMDMNESIYDEYPNFDEEFELPQIPDVDTLFSEDVEFVCQEYYDNNIIMNHESNDMIMKDWTDRIIEVNVGDETAGSVGLRLGDSETAGSVRSMRPMQVGEPEMNEESIHVKQSYNDTCAIQSQRLILEKYGLHLTEDQLVQQAIDNGLYRPGKGTSMADMGKLLDLNNCPCTNYIGGNAADLTNALAQGKMVMMAVDSGELWRETGLGKLWERIEDKIPFIGGADHALLVTGIDASDPENVKVIVTDPGSGDLNKAYPLEQFIDAAKDSHCFMTITNNPVPNVFDAYNNPLMEHLPTIGGLQYHQFMLDYEPYMCSGKALPMDVASELANSISLSSCWDSDDEQRDDDSDKNTIEDTIVEMDEPEYEEDEVHPEHEEGEDEEGEDEEGEDEENEENEGEGNKEFGGEDGEGEEDEGEENEEFEEFEGEE